MNTDFKLCLSFCALLLAMCPPLAAQDSAVSFYTASFKNSKTGRCLHTNDRGAIFTWPCESANRYQDWTVIPASLGVTYYLKNKKTGLCITTHMTSTVPYSAPCDGSHYQQFLIPTNSPNLILGLGNNRCLNNVTGSSVDSTVTGQECYTKTINLWTSIR